MKLSDKIRQLLGGGRSATPRDPDALYIHVRCARCGSVLQVRADRRYDLQRDFDSGGYVLHKEMMDGTCFSLMQAEIHYDPAMRVVSQEISGGEFITVEEYEAARQKPSGG